MNTNKQTNKVTYDIWFTIKPLFYFNILMLLQCTTNQELLHHRFGTQYGIAFSNGTTFGVVLVHHIPTTTYLHLIL